MPDASDYLRCPHLFASSGPRCELAGGHLGPHNARVIWGDAFADADTIQMPPIRETFRRRPPAPSIRELSDRAELLEELGRELQRELRELAREHPPADDDDQADDEQMADAAGECSSVWDRGDGVEFQCVYRAGHLGAHRGANGRVWA